MAQEPTAPYLAEGEKHLDAGDWPQAEAAFRRAVEADSGSAVALSKLGVALVHQKRLNEAEQAFGRAVGVNPRYAPAWSNLGNIYQETNRAEQALEAYQRAIAADPDYWIAHQNLGALYKRLGRTSEAIASLRRATKLSARSALRVPAGAGGRRFGCLGSASVLLVLLSIAVAVVL